MKGGEIGLPKCVSFHVANSTLLQAISHNHLSPYVKGRFHEQMPSELAPLATSVTHERVAVDFGDLIRRL